MRGRMMETPLLISSLIEHAGSVHASQEIVTRTVEGPVVTSTWGTVRTRAQVGRSGAARGAHPLELPPAARVLSLHQLSSWACLVTQEVDAAVVRLIRSHDGLVQARIGLGGAESAGARVGHGALLVHDDRGRLLRIDLTQGRVTSSLRVQPRGARAVNGRRGVAGR